MNEKQLACPKCKGTFFEIFQVKFDGFFFDNSPLTTTIEKCVKCRWMSNTINVDEAKRRIQVMLQNGIPDWEGFIEAPILCNKKDKENKQE